MTLEEIKAVLEVATLILIVVFMGTAISWMIFDMRGGLMQRAGESPAPTGPHTSQTKNKKENVTAEKFKKTSNKRRVRSRRGR